MREVNVSHIVVGEIAANCWIYPLDETSGLYTGQGKNAQDMPPGHQGCILVDPGAEAGKIITRLKTLKLVPLYILLTHGHFDHIAAVPGLAGAKPRPVIAIHQADAEYLGPGSYNVHCRSFSAAAGNAAYIDSLWEDMPPPDRTLREGDSIGPFTVLHLPGHTPGSIALWDKEAKNLFSGDTLFKADYGRTDLPGGSEAQIIESLKRLFAMDGGIKVYPGHGPVTTIGAEVLNAF